MSANTAIPPNAAANAGETTSYDRINDYGAVRISLAAPKDIRSWSFGEVKKPETINYRTYRPEKDGLFCEKIFGPEKDWECACGKYRGMKYKGMICDRCGVKVTHSRVRRKRMGHIELAAPVVHIWFFKAMPSRLGTLLDMKTSSLEKVVYFQDYVVIDPGQTKLKERQMLTEEQYRQAVEEYGAGSFEADMGAEAVKKLLEKLNLVEESVRLRDLLEKENLKDKSSKQKLRDFVKRLKIIESLRDSSNKCEWMILECIPVIPPDLRPLVLLDSGNFATSDLNDLYRRIINRNNRLKKLVDLNAPEVIIRNEKRMLQQSVDALFDNNRCKRPVLGSSNRPLKSLTDMIKGKQGRFRENLLGKRVDYSARSVIVVGPELKLHQCGLPKKIALELFQPFIIRRLKELGLADTIKSAKKMLERKDDNVWDILAEVTKSHPVLLNRAPTLHRMGIQAFEPVLIEGNAIRIHPLVCKGFNADFDGDQMAVHLPLSIEAQVEAHVLMMSTNNIFSPANGNPIITPSQDIVMGCYYLTASRGEEGEKVEAGDGMTFHSPSEVFTAFQFGKLGVHARVRVRLPMEKKFISEIKTAKGTAVEELPRKPGGLVITTVGRVVFNDILEPKMPFYDLALSSKNLSRIIADTYQILGRRQCIDLLDRMKETGFRESTRSGLSFASSDLRTPAVKEAILKDKDKEVEKIRRNFERGTITEQERYNKTLEQWGDAREKITASLMESLKTDRRKDQTTGKEVPYLNPIFLMANSGARGGVEQIRQLAGLRGLMAKPSGEIIETPIKSNFREGLNVLEYFSSTHGARKGLADTALKTADSGYLTRKLADVAQNVVITMHDCGTTQGMSKGIMYKGDEIDRPLSDAIRGRVSRNEILDPVTDQFIVAENEMITPHIAKELDKRGIDKISVRSPMNCQASLGVCRLCYGMDLATGALVEEGMAVGIIAAQSIGEPGTQLTMRTFHIGGVAKGSTADSDRKSRKGGIVVFERINPVAREVKDPAGNIVRSTLALTKTGEILIFKDKNQPPIERLPVPNGSELLVKDGQEVGPNTILCRWDPHMTPIITETGGKVRFEDLKENETFRKEKDSSGTERFIIMEHKGDLHPQIVIEDGRGNIVQAYYIPERAYLEVKNGEEVSAGTILAKTPKEQSANQDIVGGLPRVTEIFEARRPRDPAVMADVGGKVRIGDKKRGKRVIWVQPEDEKGRPVGDEMEHQVPHGKQLNVQTGEYVKSGDPLVQGPLVPHDILRISGAEALQDYLVHEVQQVYRSQRVEIDDKHIEIIVSQMLRKVKIIEMGDTNLLPGSVMDKFEFMKVNDRLMNECVKIKGKGDSPFEHGKIVSRDAYDDECARIEAEGGKKPTWETPKPATMEVVLLGITKAAVQSESFISAASFQETTKVLTEAALAGKADYLVGLKENVILGHLVPAGTGFKMHQDAEVRINAPSYNDADEDEEATPDLLASSEA
ncbi:DNA-directed RNA polymerase subunit beta' [Zavarzinella formosa]|uniref:DNA-directed RNA polymerase subunit beta' n=1 Tax=Zavarzinella formosa TaxID=360055 RepID=UPI0002E08E19|nr:DNA-directed RNA polymerase subunit beta' [Zavarzinella formosa]